MIYVYSSNSSIYISHHQQRFSASLLSQGKESGVKMTETGGAVVCAVATLFKGASGVAGGMMGVPKSSPSMEVSMAMGIPQ